MNNFRIFTESKADVKFLKDYCREIFNKDLTDSDFDTLGGWSGYKTGGALKPSIKENAIDNERHTILILDADDNFQTRLAEVNKDFAEFNIAPDIFLFPNNANNGSLETMLEEIAVQRSIIDCFHGYEQCIDGHEKPVLKSKIFAYLDALLPQKNKKGSKDDLIQEANRDYTIKEHWNLTHDYLNPLKDFLSPFLSE